MIINQLKMKSFILAGSAAIALLLGSSSAIRINEMKDHESVAQITTQTETDAESEARLEMMTKVTITNLHKSLKMENNKIIAHKLAKSFAEAIKATRKAE